MAQHHVEFVMGTAVSFDVRDEHGHDQDLDGADGSDAIAAAVAWLHHVDRTYSPYLSDSAISRLGRDEIDFDDLDDEVLGVLTLCEEVRNDSDGAFDAFAIPSPNGTMFDPSGLVKGWSIEWAAEILEEHGHHSFTINAGGDIAVRGRPEPGRGWSVGIRHPAERDLVAMVLDVTGPAAVATSATYERGAHIFDPRTGQPTTDLASATVVGPDLTFADAYATVLFVMGLPGLDWLSRHPEYAALAITHDDDVVKTAGFEHWCTH